MDNLRSGVLLIAAGVGAGVWFWSGAAGAVISDLVSAIRSGRAAAGEVASAALPGTGASRSALAPRPVLSA